MTLALYGKSTRRKAALSVAALLAVAAGVLAALNFVDNAGAVDETMAPSLAACVDDGGTATADCDAGDETALVQADDDGFVHVENDRLNDDHDTLTVDFDLSHIPAGSILNGTSVEILSEVDTGDVGALNLGIPSTLREYGFQVPGGISTYNPGNLGTDVGNAFGGTFSAIITVDCDSADDDNCSVQVDHVQLLIDYTPPTVNLTLLKADSSGAVPADFELEIRTWPADELVMSGDGTGTTAAVSVGSEYHLVEIDEPGWVLAGVSCFDDGQNPISTEPNNLGNSRVLLIPVDGASDITCTFTNRPFLAWVNVTKIVTNVDGDQAGFDFSISNSATEFSLMDDGNSGDVLIPMGDQVVTEAAENGYATLGWAQIFAGTACPAAMPDAVADNVIEFGTDNTYELTVEEQNTSVVCFYNESTTADIVVHKVNLGGVDDQDDAFEIDISPLNGGSDPDPAGGLTPANSLTFTVDGDETYNVIENPLPGYIVEYYGSWDIDTCFPPQGEMAGADSDGIDVEVASGQTLEVCVVNRPVGTVIIEKIDASDLGDTWDFALNGPGLAETPQILGSDELSFEGAGYGNYDAVETTAGVLASIDECPEPPGEGTVVTLATPFGTTIDEPGEEIRFVFTNQDCSDVLGTGALIIEKWLDIDGDGERGAGEDAIEGWEMTVTGPEFPVGMAFETDADGIVVLDGIATGAYTVSEEMLDGYVNSGLIIDSVVETPATVANITVADDADTVVEFGNRLTNAIIVIKTVTDNVGSETAEGWDFLLTGCGIAVANDTDADGMLVFGNLGPCATYSVTELGANSDGFVVSPSSSQAANLVEESLVTLIFHNQRDPETTPVETPGTPATQVTNTPTNTATTVPTTPVATNTSTPQETVAGELTPGPGTEGTPIPPEAGTGLAPESTNINLWLIAAGVVGLALAAATTVAAAGKRR
jgi:hypothetical protein